MRLIPIAALLLLSAAPSFAQCPNGRCPAPQSYPQFVGPPVQRQQFVLPQAVPQQPKTYPYQDVILIDGRPTVITVTGAVEPKAAEPKKSYPVDGWPDAAPQAGEGRKVGPLLRAMAKSRLTREVMAETGAGRLTARWRVELAIDDLTIAGAAYQAGMPEALIAAAEAGGDFPWDRFFELLELVVQILLKFLLF